MQTPPKQNATLLTATILLIQAGSTKLRAGSTKRSIAPLFDVRSSQVFPRHHLEPARTFCANAQRDDRCFKRAQRLRVHGEPVKPIWLPRAEAALSLYFSMRPPSIAVTHGYRQTVAKADSRTKEGQRVIVKQRDQYPWGSLVPAVPSPAGNFAQ